MKRCILIIFLFSLILPLHPSVVVAGDGVSSCGYEMKVIPAGSSGTMGSEALNQPAILDAWTTNDPLNNPTSEMYNFTRGQGPIGFVVRYFHIGGPLPEQMAVGGKCGDESQILKTCRFKWTIGYLPPGEYFLVNYFDQITFAPGEYDWASKVGNVVFGWPDSDAIRPWCFTVQ